MLNLSELETDLRRAQCEMAEIDEEIEQQRRVVSQVEDGFFRTYAETMLTCFEEQREIIVADRERIAKQLAAA
jgi:beta-lactamase regulating signal transducer with metallopeptidase domain